MHVMFHMEHHVIRIQVLLLVLQGLEMCDSCDSVIGPSGISFTARTDECLAAAAQPGRSFNLTG